MVDWPGVEADRWPSHVVAVVVLLVAILLRWWMVLTSTSPLGDETIYLNAFRAVSAGSDPQTVGGFYYPATFANCGSWLLQALGETGTLAVLRGVSVAGLVLSVWLSACLLPVGWIGRLVLAVLYIAVSPGVHYGLGIGNVTFAVTGAIFVGLLVWRSRAVWAGTLLGASVAVKPLAPLAILALIAHRPIPASRRNQLAGAIAGLLASILLALSPGYLSTPGGMIDRLPFIRSISLNRILVLIGFEVPPIVVAMTVAIIVVVVARWIPMDRWEILAYGGLAAVLAVPVIWSHTLLLTLPLQTLAIRRAVVCRRHLSALLEGDGQAHLRRRYELPIVLLAAAALQLTQGAGAIDDRSLWFQLLVLSGAYAAAPALMVYVLATGPTRSKRVEAVRPEPTGAR